MNSKWLLIGILCCFLLGGTTSYGQTTKDFLSVPGPITFKNKIFNLAWSSHPTENYYKQEYLIAGDSIEKFNKLIIIEALVGKDSLKDVVAKKIGELEKLKETNPVVNYESFEKNGEIMLDFLLSQNTPDGKLVSIVERNVYRYKSFTNKDGQLGVILFGMSERAYGNNIEKFFKFLKAHRDDLIINVGAFKIPDIALIQ